MEENKTIKEGKEKVEVKVGVYDMRAISEMYNLLNKINIIGVEQAEIVSIIAKYLRSPIKEDVIEI